MEGVQNTTIIHCSGKDADVLSCHLHLLAPSEEQSDTQVAVVRSEALPASGEDMAEFAIEELLVQRKDLPSMTTGRNRGKTHSSWTCLSFMRTRNSQPSRREPNRSCKQVKPWVK